ncbi:DUF1698 domain-containing protein, partial [Salmonella enterica subsp. enterica serovar Kentucky]|nr:DUF1698 domain-containing protein [Salmonella enterica subsp. enterica serovar Kentucky]
ETRQLAGGVVLHAFPEGKRAVPLPCVVFYHGFTSSSLVYSYLGIDPTQLFLCQFEAVRKLLGNDQRAHLLPLGIEQLPALKAFD